MKEKDSKQKNIMDTISFWSQHSGQNMTDDDAKEAIKNISEFFMVLVEWGKESQGKGGEKYV